MSMMTNTNLYQVLYRGDSRIASAHPSAVLLVGLTRAGKSTTFNWILNKAMRGEIEDDDDIIAHYVNVVEGSDSAEVGNSFTSVTLCPNVVELDRANRISLIDMAGYKDKRDYIGVLGVSYFLKAVFEKVRRAKFLIVLGEDKLTENSGDGIIDTFSEFIRMFNVHLMDAPTKQAFYNSVSIVVTRSKEETRHHSCLKRIIKMLKDPRLNVEMKPEIVSLVDYLVIKNRIQPFKVALLDQQPQRCSFFERFDRMGWEFFDIQSSEQALGQELISLPYSKDYQTLGQDQRTKFEQDITQRVESYIEFSKILKTFIGSVQRNWRNCIAQWETEGLFSLNLANYSDLFDQVRSFLQKSDFYHSENFVTIGFRAEYRSLSLVQTIRKVLQIYKIAENIGRQANDFMSNMKAYTLLFSELIDCLLAFASSAETEHLLLRLKFIIRQGFRQFSKLYQINRDIIHDVSQKMKDNVNEIFDCPQHQFIDKFVRKIDLPLMGRLFTNVDDLTDYESLFNDYELTYMHMFTQTGFFSRHKCDIQMSKAALLRPNGRKRQVLQCEINAFRSLCQIAEETSRSYQPQHIKDQQLKTLYIKKLSTIKAIISLLRQLKEMPKANIQALNLSIHISNINAACEIYQTIVDDTHDATTKKQKIGDYADYCLEWGRLEKATTLLQWKLDLEGQSFQDFQATIKKMEDVAKNQSTHLKKYQTNLASICSSAKKQEEDSLLVGYLEEIQASINEQ